MLPPDEAARLLQRALAAVVPSQWEETFGLVAVEAMAAGVAPVAPGRGSFPELVTHGVNGVLFAPGDPAALAAVLADVDGEPDRFRAYGRQARATYQKRFHPAANVEELLAVYRFAIETPVGGRRGLG
jgi:glycosyltransferase involved in cell wall biosynthesis